MASDTGIPLIDLAPLKDGVDGARAIAGDLNRALKDVGFMIIINHGVPAELIERTFAEAKRFHDQPMEVKHALRMNRHNNGYMAEGRYNVRTSRVSEASVKPDANEAFFLKRERLPDDPLLLADRRFAGPNQWPDALLGFRETVIEYTNAVDQMSARLLPALALSLDLDADFFANAFSESQFSFRLSHYPQVAREDNLYGIAPHTDMNFMTFLPQSGVAGLQIATRPGEWRDVPYVENSFVVNTGDTLHRWSNGRYLSTPHRALPPVGQDRYAIPFFWGPHLDTVIECLPTCTSATAPARFPPITYSDFMTWWYDANYNAADQDDLAVVNS